MIIISFSPLNISFGHVKETSQWDVSFKNPKHMLIKTVIKKEHEWAQFQIQWAQNTFRIREYF